MHTQPRIIRAAQRISDAVHQATGWTCYRQGGTLALINVGVLAATAVITAIFGTLYVQFESTLVIAVGGIAVLGLVRVVPDSRPLISENTAHLWPLHLAYSIGSLTSLACMTRWVLTVAAAPTGDVPANVLLSMIVSEATWGLHLLRLDRSFARACAAGELTAQPEEPIEILLIDVAVGAALVINTAVHGFDLPSAVAAAAAPLIIAASLLGRCRPRPPGARRSKRKSPSGFLAHSAT